MSEPPIPARRKWLALGLAAALAVVLIIFRDRVAQDFWPLDRSFVGPNLLASIVQWVIVLVAAVLLWPPTRRRIHAFADRKLEGLHAKVQALHDRHDAHDEHAEALREGIEQLRVSVSALHAEHRKLHDKIDNLG